MNDRGMFRAIFEFELRYQLRRPLFWIATSIFALLAFGAVTTDAVTIGGSIGAVNRNAPFVVLQLLMVLSIVAVIVTVAFVASCVQRDTELGTQELFLSTPMGKLDYLLGRFAGALVVSVLLMVGVALAIALGGVMPWLEAERVGPFRIAPYAFGLAVIVIPNLFITGSMFFSLATITRSSLHTYAGVVALFTGYGIANALLSDLDNRWLATLIDPFATAAFDQATRYWTIADKNTLVPGLDLPLVVNRLLWVTIAAGVLAATCSRFSFSLSRKSKRTKNRLETDDRPTATTVEAPVAVPFDSLGQRVSQWLGQTRIETFDIIRSAPFLIIVALGIANLVASTSGIDRLFGTPVLPVTHLMLDAIQSSFLLFVVIVLTFYSGELVWRERRVGLAGVIDALPVKTWVLWSSKLAALCITIALLMTVAGLTTIAVQAYHGYFDFELPLYAKGLGMQTVTFSIIAVLALALQAVVNNKHLGFLLMVLFYISLPVMLVLGLDHHLYLYATSPAAPYSDMNGYGHFVGPMLWFKGYWLAAATLLGVIVHLVWVRGTDTSFGLRRRLVDERFSTPVAAVTMVTAIILAAIGGHIFYNTNVVNEYVPRPTWVERGADYEKAYKQHEALPQPRITAMFAAVDIFPDERRVEIRGHYDLVNKTDQPIADLHLITNPRVRTNALSLPEATLVEENPTYGYAIHRLAAPLAPGSEMTLKFNLSILNPGFVNSGSNTNVVENGTFFHNTTYFPHIGYSRSYELGDPNLRRKHGLDPLQRMPLLEDESARGRNFLTGESDWVEFETVVSTSADQIAIAPGYLQREWIEDGRRYFHYAMDAPILGLVAYQSARYEVARDRWNDVAIEIYHHPSHTRNVARMIDAVKKSLDYLTTELGPYQHRQVRIVEFPGYQQFAQSLANTIPFSESIGFIARLDDPDDIDYVFYVTAHEVAHQWWPHQAISANVQGATALSETMAQHAALMIMQRELGAPMMRKFLEYELERYLRGRGDERIEELPLLRVENQPYIHYNKGGLVMYALADYLGEDVLNGALRGYLERVKFQQPPYTTTAELLAAIRAVTPDHLQSTVSDLFEHITLFDLRAVHATSQPQADGTWAVHLDVESTKLYADASGVESEVTVDDWIEIGVFGPPQPGKRDGELLYLEKHHLTGDTSQLDIMVRSEPARAGIDPLSKLIDRKPDDNMTKVVASARVLP